MGEISSWLWGRAIGAILCAVTIAFLYPGGQAAIADALPVLTPFQRGIEAFQAGRVEEAVTHFSAAIAQNPDRAAAYSNRCLAYIDLQRYDLALADCDRAIALHPRPETYLNRGIARHAMQHTFAAVRDFEAAIALAPDCAEAYLNRGIAHYELGNTSLALADLQQAADCFLRCGDREGYRHAIAIFEQMQSSGSNYA